MPILAQHILS